MTMMPTPTHARPVCPAQSRWQRGQRLKPRPPAPNLHGTGLTYATLIKPNFVDPPSKNVPTAPPSLKEVRGTGAGRRPCRAW